MFARRTRWNLEVNRLSAALDSRCQSGKPIFDLTVSNPTECGFSYDSANILAALSQQSALRYHPEPLGLLSAREAVSVYYAERGQRLPPERIVLATGTSEAYSFVFRLLCEPGDEILAAAPSYPLFQFLADIQDVTLVHYPLLYDNGWHIDFHTLESRISLRTRAVVVVHPNNPTGNYCSPDHAVRLQSLCASRGVALIVDEVFFDFALAAQRQFSFAADSAALTFTLSGASKICGLPQMKLAWLAVTGPESLRNDALARLEIIADAYLSMNAPVQLAAPALLATRTALQRQVLARIRENLAELDRALAQQRLCSRLEVQGGWNVVLRVPAAGSDEGSAVRLLERTGVYAHPGHLYDFSGAGYLVLSLITPGDIFKEGVAGLLGFFQ
jgi:alanine-synthesizing transaminase